MLPLKLLGLSKSVRCAAPLGAMLATVAFIPSACAAIAFDVDVNPDTGRTAISPFLYGTNQDITGVTFGARRQGGNRMPGYNWETNASNAGSDYLHQSDNYLTWTAGLSGAAENTPAIVVTKFHDQSLAAGTPYSVVTLPNAGFVAADKSGPVSAAEVAPSARWKAIVHDKPTAITYPPSTSDGAVYTDELLARLVSLYGSASTATGIKGYCFDNEPDLWSETHARLHPAKPGAAELITRSVELAKTVKRVDSAAETIGFVSYGFYGYYAFQDAPDWSVEKTKGAYSWYVDYYLDQMRQASTTAGKRLLDVLDLHNYSEARGGGERVNAPGTWTNLDCNKARIQAPRSYWDTTYVESSWIADSFRSFLPLLPRVKSSIATFYPGTKLALTEYNFGGESHISGGIAQADTLGIFGQQGVYLANWWQLHDNPTYIAAAFKLYLNYDGAGAKFGNTSVTATTSNRASGSAYAAIQGSSTSALSVIVLNKDYDNAATVTIRLGGTTTYTRARVFAFDSTSATLTERTAVNSITGNQFTYSLPALTAAHFVLETAAPVTTPVIERQPVGMTAAQFSSVSFDVGLAAGSSGTATYQWFRNGVAISGATAARYSIARVQSADAATYTVAVTNSAGTTTSSGAVLTVGATSGRIAALSTRGPALVGDNILIAGFALGGSTPKTVLIRGLGPTLGSYGVSGAIANPQIRLYRGTTLLAANDDWSTQPNASTVSATAAALGAAPLPNGSLDAALVATLDPGAYTMQISGVAGGTGVALAEAYDGEPGSATRLSAISTRGYVGTGDAIMIPGIVLETSSRTVLVRGAGPFLAQYGLTGTLPDPVLSVRDSAGREIFRNDDWSSNSNAAEIAARASTLGLAPFTAGSKDAALLVTLPPGPFTVLVSDAAGGAGIALVEVYESP